MSTTPTVFEVTEATGFQSFPEKRSHLGGKTRGQIVETTQLLRMHSREITFAKKMLKNAEDGSQLPHHLKDTYLRYTNTVTKEFFELKHTYFKFDGKIYAALKRTDIIGSGQTSNVKRVVDVETGKLAALKLLKRKALDESGNLAGKSDTIPLVDLIPIIATGKKKANPLKTEEYSFGFLSNDPSENTDNIPFSADILLKTNIRGFACPEKNFQLIAYSEETILSYTTKKAKEIFALKEQLITEKPLSNISSLEKKISALEAALAEDLQKIFLKSTKALQDIHTGRFSKTNIKYVHTDVKPDNILVSIKSKKGQNRPSLIVTFCDIDSRVPLDPDQDGMSLSTSSVSGHGTPLYLSPEAPTPHTKGDLRYSVKGEVYSLGKTFAVLLETAFPKSNSVLAYQTQEKIAQLRAVASSMCDSHLSPAERPSLSAVEEALIAKHQNKTTSQDSSEHQNFLDLSTSASSLFSKAPLKQPKSSDELSDIMKEADSQKKLPRGPHF
ncbi:MAG: hypothetical protein Q8L78_04025 [Coxiellaceae bacterium]|nr:hypothetical protein [Coxiellaceae bacterium]